MCNFAAEKMKRQRKRIFSAWFLLSVFLLTTTLSALHIHQPAAAAAIDCVDCEHHVQHHGHLTASTASMHDCVLCQFLSLPFIPATILAIVFSVSFTQKGRFYLCPETAQKEPSLLCTRGPPYYI